MGGLDQQPALLASRSMWTIAAVYAPRRHTYFYRAYAAEFPNVFSYRFRVLFATHGRSYVLEKDGHLGSATE